MDRPPLYDVFPRGKWPVRLPFRLPPEEDIEVSAIPGVLSTPDGYMATWDAALVLYQRFGWPLPQFPAETSDLPGLPGYFERGLHQKLRNYQWTAASFLANRPYAILGDPMRCLDGDTVVITNRRGAGRRRTLRELHRLESHSRSGRLPEPTRVACYDEEGSIVSNELVATHHVGMKEGFEVRVGGQMVIASAEHKFRTPEGYVALQDLRPGDLVLMRERAPTRPRGPRSNPYRVQSVRGHPHARVYHVKRKDRPDEVVHHVLKHRLVYEAEVLNGMSVPAFVEAVRSGDHGSLTFLEPGTHVHHKNEDPTDNRASNLEVLSKTEHHREHAEMGAKRHVLFRGVPRPIDSITPVGPRDMYDLTLKSPLNNYVANEFVVHNSGKTLSTLAALQLIDAKSVCIVCPSIAKWVWAREVSKWLGEEVLILEGRSMREGRVYCGTCGGSGRVVADGRTRKCRACRQWNGQSYGYRIYEVQTLDAQDKGSDVWYCRRHPEVSTTSPDGPQILCKKCQVDLEEQVRSARFTVVNPDILAPQREKIGGVWKFRSDMPGLGDFLAAVGFDTVVVDEAHMFRARPKMTKEERHRGDDKEFRAESLSNIARSAERMWMLTGTPIYAYLRDIYMLLHLASHGVWGDQWSFDRYFCLPPEAPVWMADHSFRRIEDVKVGDVVWGWDWDLEGRRRKTIREARVLDVFSREEDIVEVEMESGRVVRCTPNHLWANAVSYKPPVDQRYIPARTWRAVERRSQGRISAHDKASRLGFMIEPSESFGVDHSDYKRGYLHGLCDGDGSITHRWNIRPHEHWPTGELVRQVSIRLKEREPLDRAAAFAASFGVEARVQKRKVDYAWLPSGEKALELFCQPRRPDESAFDYWRGYLGGLYDAEGWGYVFAQYENVNPEVYANIKDALSFLGFEYREAPNRQTVAFKGGRSAFVRFWNLCRPTIDRKRKSFWQVPKGRDDRDYRWKADKVIDIRPVGRSRVHCLKTETGNFVAYGYGSSNCNGHKGEHGWVNTGKSWKADDELSWRLKFYLLKRELRDIRPELPAKQRDIRRYDAPANLKVKRVKGGDYQAAVDEAIKNVSKVKLEPVVEECLAEMSEGRKVVVFAYYRETAKKLFQAFEHATKKSRAWKSRMQSVGARVWLADGEVSPKNRVAMGEKFVAHQTAGVFVATIEAFQVAVSLAGASTVHFAELHPVPGAVLQAEARPEDGTTPLMVVYHVVNNSIDEQCLLDLQEKIDQIDSAVGDKDAAALAATFGSVEEEKAARAEKLFSRMLADLKEEDFDDD